MSPAHLGGLPDLDYVEFARCLFEESNDAFIIVDPDFETVLDVNATTLRLTQRRKQELAPSSIADLLSSDEQDGLAKVVAAFQKTGLFHSREGFSLATREDGPLQVNISVSRIHTSQRVLGLIVARDITARKRAEEANLRLQDELAHIARLAAIGETVAEISHEINQPLSAVANYAAASREKLNGDDPLAELDSVRKWVDHISSAAILAGSLCHRLSSFVKKTDGQLEAHDIKDIVTEIIDIARWDAKRAKAKLSFEADAAEMRALVNRVEIQQVVLNLIKNACESLAATDQTDKVVKIRATVQNDCVTVAVEDSGPGFGEADVERLFTPFVTTKQSGLGMGLAICRSIIKKHGGSIDAANRSPTGARLQFTLPRAATA
ncbi:MAG: ATP-binding protein [Pirellulaceae bacterium]|jgi:two-component system sensor kinase FixL|nr:ATP-binding protein [Pirellulaceae bacterium]